MKLIFAQGNPGAQYANTRHNVGWRVLDTLADENNLTWTEKSKFHAFITEYTSHGEKIMLAKPTTFYNDTGMSARALVDFYKLDPSQDVLVLHDELALPFGTIRVREKGSDAGNNGIKSLNAHLGQTYARLRIGIANDMRAQMGDINFVLASFRSEENTQLASTIIPQAHKLIEAFAKGTLEVTSHKTL